MSDSTPAPNSPEAKAKAAKVKSYFMLIVAVNIALIGIVMWPRGEKKKTPPAASQVAPPRTSPQSMEQIFDNALAAYNTFDSEKFLRCFSPTAQPAANAAFFENIIKGLYHQEYGTVTGKKPIPSETSADANFGMLVYEAQCKKRAAVKLSVNFRRENGDLKIVQWRMEKL